MAGCYHIRKVFPPEYQYVKEMYSSDPSRRELGNEIADIRESIAARLGVEELMNRDLALWRTLANKCSAPSAFACSIMPLIRRKSPNDANARLKINRIIAKKQVPIMILK